MASKKLKHVEVEELTHRKLKIYSLLTGTPMHKLADEAINEYLKNHSFEEDKTEFKELKGVKI